MKIIIADDHTMYRKGLADFIKKGYPEAQIEEAANGKELLELQEKYKAELILLDLEMPIMDGIEAASKLLNKFPGTKIIVLTMHDDKRFMQKMIELGVHGYLLKGDEEDNINEAIKAVISDKYYFDQQSTLFLREEALRNKKFRENFHVFKQISDRELEILRLICQEKTNKEIAEQLSISVRTVDNHRNSLLIKCKAKNTAGLIVYAIQHNLVDIHTMDD